MNIATILEPEIEPIEGQNPAADTQEARYHNMKVCCLGSKIVIEDANWILTDEKGKPLHTIPTFRVMLGADPEGVRLFVWKDGADFSGAPDYEDLIAGWEYGQATEVTRQNRYTYDARGDHAGNLATSQNVLCTLAIYVRKIAELKAEKLKVKLPSGCGSTTFDRSTCEYVVTFAESVEGVM